MNTSSHIDQLAQWWETAEEGSPSPGDTIIINLGSGGYMIEPASEHWGDWERYDDTRILARAPKPKPAWHDAPAVIARWEDPSGDESEPFDGVDTFVNSGDGWWIGGYDNARPAEELHDVTPLIEAKVTDEMVTRAQVEMMRLGLGDYSDRTLASILTAALGLDSA